MFIFTTNDSIHFVTSKQYIWYEVIYRIEIPQQSLSWCNNYHNNIGWKFSVTSAWVGAIRLLATRESWLLSENRALEQQFCFALHIALEAARLPISSFSPPLSGHMTHTQAEGFYNFAYVRRFLVLVRFKNRPHVLNLTDVTPCPESWFHLYLGSIIKSGLWALFSVWELRTQIELQQAAFANSQIYHHSEVEKLHHGEIIFSIL